MHLDLCCLQQFPDTLKYYDKILYLLSINKSANFVKLFVKIVLFGWAENVLSMLKRLLIL